MFANNSEFIFTEFYTSSLPCTIQMVPSVYHASTVVGPPRFFFFFFFFFGGGGGWAFISVGQMPDFGGNRETKTTLGNRDHEKTNF